MTSQREGAPNITELLRAWGDGKAEAMDELLPLVYDDLRRRAAGYLRQERPDHTLQTTGASARGLSKAGRSARGGLEESGSLFCDRGPGDAAHPGGSCQKQASRKARRGGEDVRLEDELLAAADANGIDIAALDEALSRLAAFDPQQEKLVELRYFAGLSLDETAKALDISRATAAREWQVAKAWLYRELTR
jgi:RNA polymerase sigma factor (sigma-70 family)